MAGNKSSSNPLWSMAAGADSATYLDTHFRQPSAAMEAAEAASDYVSTRLIEGNLASAYYWQMHSCAKEGFQATDEVPEETYRSQLGNIACNSYDPGRAGFERMQQKLAASMRELDVPTAVADLFAAGYDLDVAYTKAGVTPPYGDADNAAEKALANARPMQDPATGAAMRSSGGGRAVRLATQAGAGTPWTGGVAGSVGMRTAAAYRGDRVVSVFEDGAPCAYTGANGGTPAGTPPPGPVAGCKNGAGMYARLGEAGSGPTLRGNERTAGNAALYNALSPISLRTTYERS